MTKNDEIHSVHPAGDKVYFLEAPARLQDARAITPCAKLTPLMREARIKGRCLILGGRRRYDLRDREREYSNRVWDIFLA